MKIDQNRYGCTAEVTGGCDDEFPAIIRVTDPSRHQTVAIDLTRVQVLQLVEALQQRVPERRTNKKDRRRKS